MKIVIFIIFFIKKVFLKENNLFRFLKKKKTKTKKTRSLNLKNNELMNLINRNKFKKQKTINFFKYTINIGNSCREQFFQKKILCDEFLICRYNLFFLSWKKIIFCILSLKIILKKIYQYIICKNMNNKKVKLRKLKKWILLNKNKLKLK